MKHRYIDGVFGQVHLLENEPHPSGKPPLFCLHATAYSSRTFRPLLAAADNTRKIIAPDTPGYGQSDGPGSRIDMGGYADAFIDTIARMAALPADVLGYHTGAYIAAEAAIRRPDLFRRLVMVGVPFFHGPDREAWRARLASPHLLGETLTQFDERWQYFVGNRSAGVPLERGFANFVDELKAYPNGAWAHQALFDYDDVARLALLPIPVLVVNFPGHLAEGSREAAALMPRAEITEHPALVAPVLELAPAKLCRIVEDYLDR